MSYIYAMLRDAKDKSKILNPKLKGNPKSQNLKPHTSHLKLHTEIKK
jgi:hypothetical protein